MSSQQQQQHKKRNSLDQHPAPIKSAGVAQPQGAFQNFHPMAPPPPPSQPQYSSNSQKQRQVSYSPFSQSNKGNINLGPSQGHSSQVQKQGNYLNNGGVVPGNYSSSQQQQMMMMMQQLQKSQIQNVGNPGQQQNNPPPPSFNMGIGAPHHNRSESAAASTTPGSNTVVANNGVLDRQLIDFMSSKHHNMSLNHHDKKQIGQSNTPQPIISASSAFNKKKKSHQMPSTASNGPGGYGSIIIGSNNPNHNTSKDGGLHLFAGNQQVPFSSQQKKLPMSESDRRRQQQMPSGMNLIKKPAVMTNEEKQRSIRSANTSPTTHHFMMNGLAAHGSQGSNQGMNLLHEILPTPQQTNSLLIPRPATGGLMQQQNSQSNSQNNTAKNSPNTSKLLQRPKTSTKIDHPTSQNQYSSNAPNLQKPSTTGSNFLGAGSHHHSKSVGDESVKRMLKKNTNGSNSKGNVLGGIANQSSHFSSTNTSKGGVSSNTRPSSGQKKRTTSGIQSNTSQGHYDQQQQQIMMMLLLQQQQSKVKSISDSHRAPNTANSVVSQQKINNFVDTNINNPTPSSTTQNSISLSNQELQQIKAQGHIQHGSKNGVNQSTDFANMNSNKAVQLNSKFQSAPATPTKHQTKKLITIEENDMIKPQLVERNVITKYAFATRVGFIPNNPNKVNQDAFILSPNLNGCNFRHYFGVCDGHGQNGKEASGFIKMRLPQLVGKSIDDNLSKTQGQEQQQTPKLSPSYEEYKQIFHKNFISCNEELDFTNFDVNLSGSTVCTVLFNGTKVYCANAGDSRAIKVAFVGTQNEQGGSLTRKKTQIEVTALNRDHKPELKDEAERIHKRGGRIDSFRDYYNNGEPIGPQRVWLPHEEIPGLAMSRSMGDKVAHSVGVTAEPETWEFTLGLNDKYLVIASDGVWEFLSNEDVANIVYPFYEQNAPEAAANALVKAAFKKWKQEEEVIDDITVVIIFLEVSMAYNSLRANIKQQQSAANSTGQGGTTTAATKAANN